MSSILERNAAAVRLLSLCCTVLARNSGVPVSSCCCELLDGRSCLSHQHDYAGGNGAP